MARYRGSPILSMRLPEWQIKALKIKAAENETDVSTLLRDLIDGYLRHVGMSEASTEILDGQIKLEDLDE